MNFEFSKEQDMLRTEVRKFLEQRCSAKEVRKVLEGELPFHAPLWQEIAGLGLQGTAIPEAYGGTGAGYLELCVIAEEMGRALAPVPFSSTVYLAAEAILAAGSETQKKKYLPAIARGETVATLAVAETAGRLLPERSDCTAENGTLKGRKRPVPHGADAQIAIVAARTGSGLGLFIADLTDASVKRNALECIDPSQPLTEIQFDGTPAEALGAAGQGGAILSAVLDRAAVLYAFEQLGGAQAALDMAVAYAKDRYAFGRPIGSFQALKHMMADMYVSTVLARSNCYFGAWALSSGAHALGEAAATARVAATKAFQLCAKNNIQVHGGMGFTWAFDCHLYYRRSNHHAVLLGSLGQWEDMLIARLKAARAA